MANRYWNEQVAPDRESEKKPAPIKHDKKMTADLKYTKVSKNTLPVKNPSGMTFQENTPDA